MIYPVRVLRRAQHDVESCYAYIAQNSSQGAVNWIRRFAETRESLAIDPHQRALAPEAAFVGYEVREVFFKTSRGNPYRILFTVHANEVLILRLRGPGQDYASERELPRRQELE